MKKTNLKLFVDMDGTLTEWRKACSIEHLYLDGYFYTLKPNVELIGYLNNIKNKIEVYIASSYITEKSVKEKNDWLDKYFPIENEHRIFVPNNINKSQYIINHLKEPISKNYILLDDFTPNLIEWENAGGTSIKALNGINRKEGKWKGWMFDIFDLKFKKEGINEKEK